MNKELIMIGSTMLILFFTSSPSMLIAQNVSTNASNEVGNASASINQSASELGKIPSEVRSDTLNETGEAAQKVAAGAAGVIGNITEEIKERVSGNNSNSSK